MKRIWSHFQKYTLTADQSELLVQLDEFLKNDTPCFILKGYAGTGKTFMMQGLTKFLKQEEISFRLAAPTGRAAKIISQKTQLPAYTIHKTIYSTKDLREYKVQNLDGSETYKFYYDLSLNQDNANTIYIVDEASMISNEYSEGEFFRFGSGYLLNDLISYIGLKSTKNQRKLIFIGDDAQLPPVNMNFSPALDEAYLLNSCSIKSQSFELTEVVRQKNESGILANATQLRNAIRQKKFNKIKLNETNVDTRTVLFENLLDVYLTACNRKVSDDVILIAHSNATVKEYNDLVREQFFPGNNKLASGDKIIIVQNNYNYEIELLNGEFGSVKEVSNSGELREVTLKQKALNGQVTELQVNLRFCQALIQFKDVQNNNHEISCKVIENLLYSTAPELSSEEQKALYIDFWIRNPKLDSIRSLLQAKSINYARLNDLVTNLGPADVNTKVLNKIRKLQEEYFRNPDRERLVETSLSILSSALRADPYFNALRIKFGYAVTCHKAQGGEWKHAFVNCKTSMGYFNLAYFRWLYTAITRAVDHLYVLNPPDFDSLSTLIPPSIEHLDYKDNLIIIDEDMIEIDNTFNIPATDKFQRLLFFVVNDLVKVTDLQIIKYSSTNYQEHYTFARGHESVLLRINYDSDKKITSISKPPQNSKLVEELMALLTPIILKKIVSKEEIKEAESVQKNFEFDQPFLKEFYEAMLDKLKDTGIMIDEIEHNSYHEIYVFKRNGLQAAYKFHYRKNGIFRTSEIIPTRTTGLANEINELLS